MVNLKQRHKYILDELNRQGCVKITDIAEALEVSKVTIRKDIKTLEEQGELEKVHGSARLIYPHVPDIDTHVKDSINRDAKLKIAAKAMEFVDSRDSILIASGSTIYALVEQLRDFVGENLNIVTPFLKVGIVLNNHKNINVIQLGGKIHPKSLSTRSEETTRSLDDCFCSKLFLGVDGIDLLRGITTSSIEEAKLSQKMMSASSQTIVLADSSKFDQCGFGRICSIEGVDVIITDDALDNQTRAMIEEAGVKLIIAD